MEVFQGQADPEHQIHEYNPGIAANDLLWTTPVPSGSVKVESDNKTIAWRLTNFATPDYHDVVSALRPGVPGPSVPATVSFAMRWGEVLDVAQIRDTQNRFTGRFIHRIATVQWEADQRDFKFVSDPANTSKSEFALIGEERNGVFFS